jgi:hypothetical protein
MSNVTKTSVKVSKLEEKVNEMKPVGKRGRKPLELNRETFQAAIQEVETKHQPTTRSKLWQLVSETDWAKNIGSNGLHPQTAMVKAEQLGLVVSTPKGKKGGDGTFGGKRGQRKVGEKRKRRGMPIEAIEAYLKNLPGRVGPGTAMYERINKLLEKAEAGNVRAAIALFYLDYYGFQMGEIRLDTNMHKTHPLGWLCPWQGRKADDGVPDEDFHPETDDFEDEDVETEVETSEELVAV